MIEDIPEPYPSLSPEQKALTDKLSPEQVEEIDRLLLVNASHHWRKVASVIGKTMMDLEGKIFGIPDIYFADRIKLLAESGRFESQGNLDYMRYSEVRFPTDNTQYK